MQTKKNLIFKLKQRGGKNGEIKQKTKIKFKNRLNETSLLPKSFVCQSGDWKWDWKCLHVALYSTRS